MGNFHASGFNASMSSKNETKNITNREKGIKFDVLGTYTLGEVGFTNNKENTVGNTIEENKNIEGGALLEIKVFGRQKYSKIEGILYVFYEIND